MKKKLINLLLLLLIHGLTFLHAQEQNKNDDYKIFRYPNGVISSEGYMREGRPDGYWKSYYVTGVLKSEGKRRNFLLDSVWVFYSQTGDTLEKIDYLFGKKSGYYLKYKRDNKYGLYVYSRELYTADKRAGTAYLYFPDGRVKQSLPYIDGKKNGLSREYNADGDIITLYEYNNDFLISRERINRFNGDGLKSGPWKEFHENGAISKDMTYRDDLLHGYYREYDKNGMLRVAMLYDMGNIVEESAEDDPEIEIVNRYDDNDRLIYSGPFRGNVPVGIHRDYNSNGEVIKATIYNDNGVRVSEGIIEEDGTRNGKWTNFYLSGEKKETGYYTNSRRSGQWIFYNTQGSTIQKGIYRNGRADGRWTWYYDDGKVLREEDYYQGRRDGEFIEYSKTGEIISSGQFVDNEKNGAWVYTVGDHREEGNYIVGLRDGLWKYFDNEGKIRYKGKYIQGNPEGYHIYYWDNGKVREEQYFRRGLKDKSWKKYDIEGNLVMTVAYRDDIEKRINGVRVNLPESDVKIIK